MNDDNDTTSTDELLDTLDADDTETELGNNLVATVDVLADEIDAGDAPDGAGPGGMMTPDMALSFIKPLLRRWAATNPEQVKTALARVHLETGALLDYHEPDADPEDLLDR
jgi:hypothetical protein